MPTTITRIQKTRLGRFSLYGEEGFLFSLDSETYFSCGVEEGDTLTDNDLAALREKSDARKAKDKALQYLSLRLYGERELYDKLCLKFDCPTSAAAVAEMVRLELLDDARFAAQKAAWLKTRHKSRREASVSWPKKAWTGISSTRRWMRCTAMGMSGRRSTGSSRRSYAAKLENGKRDAVYAALCRRGFSPRTVREALNDWADAQQEGWDE